MKIVLFYLVEKNLWGTVMFRVNYCGYNVRNTDQDTIERTGGSGDYLFLLPDSRMTFYFPSDNPSNYPDAQPVQIQGRQLLCETGMPGSCILYTPGFLQFYQAEKTFSNSFVHFSCPPEEMAAYHIPQNQLFRPNKTDELLMLIRQIQSELFSPQQHSEEMLDLCMRRLLILTERSLSERQYQNSHGDLYETLQSARMMMLTYCNGEWDVDRLCRMTGLGRSQLHAYYRKFFHTSPKEELLQARMDLARYLLTNESARISEVAEQSGFANVYHFTRFFHKACGCSPREYQMRQQASAQNTLQDGSDSLRNGDTGINPVSGSSPKYGGHKAPAALS